MRTEIGVHPWAKYFQPYCDGVPLQHCRMADEELGCAEVYHHCVNREGGESRLDPRIHGTKMVFGKIEDRPINDVAARIKANPERAQEIWDEYYLPMKAEWEAEDLARRMDAKAQEIEPEFEDLPVPDLWSLKR